MSDAAPHPALAVRASDAERDQTVALLQHHFADGRLTRAELEERAGAAYAAHTTVVVSAPGLGDDIQAIKAGVLEIADIHAVSKGDKPPQIFATV